MTSGNSDDENKANRSPAKLGFWHLLISTLGAAIGVQNRKTLEKDFEQSSPIPYIAAGIIFTVLFMTSLILIVRWVLAE